MRIKQITGLEYPGWEVWRRELNKDLVKVCCKMGRSKLI